MEVAIKFKNLIIQKDARIKQLKERVKSLQNALHDKEMIDPWEISNKQAQEEDDDLPMLIETAFKESSLFHEEELRTLHRERDKLREDVRFQQNQRMTAEKRCVHQRIKLKKEINNMRQCLESAESQQLSLYDERHSPFLKAIATLEKNLTDTKLELAHWQHHGGKASSPHRSAAHEEPAIPFLSSLDTATEHDQLLLKREDESAYVDVLRIGRQELFAKLSSLRKLAGANLKGLYVLFTNDKVTLSEKRELLMTEMRDALGAYNKVGQETVLVWHSFVQRLVHTENLKRLLTKKPTCEAATLVNMPDPELTSTIKIMKKDVAFLQSQIVSLKECVTLEKAEVCKSQEKATRAVNLGQKLHEMLLSVLSLLQRQNNFCSEDDLSTVTSGALEALVGNHSILVKKLTRHILSSLTTRRISITETQQHTTDRHCKTHDSPRSKTPGSPRSKTLVTPQVEKDLSDLSEIVGSFIGENQPTEPPVEEQRPKRSPSPKSRAKTPSGPLTPKKLFEAVENASAISMRVHQYGLAQPSPVPSRRPLQRTTAPGSPIRPYTVSAPHPATVAAYTEGVGGFVIAKGRPVHLAKKR